jgi:ATP-dependent Lon protease
MKYYCTYVFKKGKLKGTKCNELCGDNSFCKKHINNQSTKIKEDDKLPKIIHVNKLVNKKLLEDNIKEKILNLETSDTNKSVIFKHYNNMKRTDSNSTEYYKNQLFVDAGLSYPWKCFYNVNDKIEKIGISKFIDLLKIRLDNEIYGMDSVKNEIINVVCKFITNPHSNRNNIALYGPAGVGKSKFIKILSEILELPMKTISLGGIKDSSFFLGHGYVYVESGPGKILQNVIDSKISNPILYFDELDKVSETDNGKDIFSFLCYLTDPTQNTDFTDHYFYGMHFDLSKIFYVFTFNDINKIDKILLDRLNIINIECPPDNDIINIIEKHCIPEIVKNIGIKNKIVFGKDNIQFIINYCKNSFDKSITSGVREYYRIIEKIILELNKNILLYPETITTDINTEFTITENLFKNLFNKIQNQINICKSSHNYMYI